MNIGYDSKRIFHNTTGLGNYSRDLVRLLSEFYPDNIYHLYNPKPAKVKRLQADGKIIIEKKPQSFLAKKLPSIWRSKWIIKQLVKDKIDIYHGLTGELPYGIDKTKIKTIVTIHDLIFVRYPELYHAIDRKIYLKKFKYAANVADVIIAISEQTKRDIVEFLDINPNKIQVIYQGCHQIFKKELSNKFQKEVLEKYHLPQNFILNVGAVNERKNVLSLIKAIKNTTHNLVILGSGTEYYKKVRAYVLENKLSERIFFLNGMSMKEVAALYRKAQLFVYPSIFEGFGIPIIEALYSKTPVITSIGGCFPEAGGPNTLYINPKNIQQIEHVINTTLADSSKMDLLTRKGYNYVQKFNDNTIARQLMNLYTKILND